MRDHDHVGFRFYAGLKRNKLTCFELFPVLVDRYETSMRIVFRVSVPREVLYAAHHLAAVKPSYARAYHFCNKLRIISKSPASYYNVFRVGIYIRNRCEIQVESIVSEIFPNHLAGFLCVFRIFCAPDFLHAFKFFYVKSRRICYPGYHPAFFIYSHEKGNPAVSFYVVHKLFQLIWRLDISAKNYDTSRRIFFKSFRHRFSELSYRRCICFDLPILSFNPQRFRLYEEHLANLFPERHLRKKHISF